MSLIAREVLPMRIEDKMRSRRKCYIANLYD